MSDVDLVKAVIMIKDLMIFVVAIMFARWIFDVFRRRKP